MEHKVWYDDKNSILHIKISDRFLEKEVEALKGKLEEFLSGKHIKQSMIHLGNAELENRATRQKSLESLIEVGITDIAFVGGSTTSRIIAKVLLKTGGGKFDGDFFSSEDEATEWLISKRK
jgi:hypothetical protein